MINAFGLSSSQIQPKGPYKGEFPSFRVYHNESELIAFTAEAVDSLIHRGFELADIVVLSGRGRVKSKLLNIESIGPFSSRHFTGKFKNDGDPVWSEGELLAESVYRFKGQSAPAVVLSEFDFQEMTEIERKKLFVGLTRAQLAVELVISPAAEIWFREKLE